MKRLAVLMVMCGSSYASADCQDEWLTFRSPSLYVSVDYSLGCYQGQRIINYSKVQKSGPKWPLPLKSVPFDQECSARKNNETGEIVEFTCRKDGESPLAGATYRFNNVTAHIECKGGRLVPYQDYSFVCINGCRPPTPKKLKVVHGEGDDCEG